MRVSQLLDVQKNEIYIEFEFTIEEYSEYVFGLRYYKKKKECHFIYDKKIIDLEQFYQSLKPYKKSIFRELVDITIEDKRFSAIGLKLFFV